MQGRARLASLLLLFLTSRILAADPDPFYRYRFTALGLYHNAESMEEVHEILAQYGPEFEVLEVTSERRISDTVTELTLAAPPPVPGEGFVYMIHYSEIDSQNYALTYEDAEEFLAQQFAEINSPPPQLKYSGVTPDGNPYGAYGLYPLPSNIVIDPASPISEKCSDYINGGEIAYVNYRRAVFYSDRYPGIGGKTCKRVDNNRTWALHSFWTSRIETQPAYFCPYGYWPYWSYYADACQNHNVILVKRTQVVTCPVEPMKPLEELITQYHSNDAEMAQLTKDLEAGANLSLRDMLTEATQQAETCVNSRFTAGGFSYKLQSGLRPQAYQAHFYDLMEKWHELDTLEEQDPEAFEACVEVRETIEAEVGRRIGEIACTAPGRNHCLDNTVAKNSKHPDGTAFDVSRANVNALMAYLAKDGPPALTVEDWVNRPNGCGVGWGGLYGTPDDVHFYLRQGEQHMDFLALIAALTAAPEPQLPPDVAHGEPVYVRVLVSGEHVDGDVIYHYTLLNQHPEEALFNVLLGAEFDDYGMVPMLSTEPVDTILHERVLPNEVGRIKETFELASYASSAPPLWEIELLSQEFSGGYYLNLRRQYGNITPGAGGIAPGQQLEGFSIRLPHADSKYYQSGFMARINWPGKYFGYPEVLDTAAPELSVSADREELWPPNNKLVDVNVNINATDDYDGRPAIKLVSITANEPLTADDLEGAEYGSDDRSFKLRAKRAGNSHDGRIYTITYSAEDAFGHLTQQSVTVTVPHDRR